MEKQIKQADCPRFTKMMATKILAVTNPINFN
jgi:hypothetical protein